MLLVVPAVLSVSAGSVGIFFWLEVLFACRDSGVSVTRLVILSGSLRQAGMLMILPERDEIS